MQLAKALYFWGQTWLSRAKTASAHEDHNPRVGGSSPSSGILDSWLCKAVYSPSRIASGDLKISKRSRNGPETFERTLREATVYARSGGEGLLSRRAQPDASGARSGGHRADSSDPYVARRPLARRQSARRSRSAGLDAPGLSARKGSGEAFNSEIMSQVL